MDSKGLSKEEMQRLANWTNLSETCFLSQEDQAAYRLRIFTPQNEIPFAGHPTIGAAHAALEAGLIDPTGEFTQVCGLGRLRMRQEGDLIWVRVPQPVQVRTGLTPADLAPALSGITPLDPMAFDTGPIWVVGRLESLEDLRGLTINGDCLARLRLPSGLAVDLILYAFNDQGGIEVRAFAPADGIDEDPVCGSGNLAAAAHLKATGLLDRLGRTYQARQGWNLGRDGRLHLKVLQDAMELGGQAVTVFDGRARL
jgi:PhzF family phenazine biosynthesis protein